MTEEQRRAAEARAAAVAQRADRPSQRRCSRDLGTPSVARAPLTRMEFRELTIDGNPMLQFNGYATVTERDYDMWDMFGPYTESVAASAPAVALASNPDVAFLINHRGMTLARTKSGTLQLGADSLGMPVEAVLDPRNTDVANLRIAMDRRDIDEMSFAFAITRGEWNADYTAYRIEEFDIDRGDVSVVNYGANPFTSAALRGASKPEMLRDLSPADLRRWESELRAVMRAKGVLPLPTLEDAV
jgi:Escherichia/Staphylococcus phage prohead protease